MDNVNPRIKDLDSKMGYNSHEMIRNKKVFTNNISCNCLKIYL